MTRVGDVIAVLSTTSVSTYLSNGTLLWRFTLNRAANLPAYDANGIIYSGGQDWLLYAYQPSPLSPIASPRQNLAYSLDAAPPNRLSTATIRAALGSGNLGANEAAYSTWLRTRAGTTSNSTQVRMEACLLLGQVGSPENLNFLANLFMNDRDSQVRASAAEAASLIGLDKDKIMMNAIAATLSSDSSQVDDTVLIAAINASAAICRFTGPTVSNELALILVMAYSRARSNAVQNAAKVQMDSFSMMLL
jgi:outer membrane protein assembly factor BamB